MAIQLSPLPYDFQELEPGISEETLKEHYLRHHKAYVEKLNMLIDGTPYDKMKLEEIILRSNKKAKEKKIYNNACQAWSHTFFWDCLTGTNKVTPSPWFTHALAKDFSSFELFQEAFSKTAADFFGSGWVWLVMNKEGKLQIITYSNTGCPLADDVKPILTLDVWEHAYYLDYKSDRKSFIKQFWQLVNWANVEFNYKTSMPTPPEIRFIREELTHAQH